MAGTEQDRTSGFTLIELLIVVAIIAILAAIAVPNFLEAQVRAKVSRVKSDQRALATAIEAYTLDNDRAPIDCNYGRDLGLWAQFDRDAAFNSLTTPVAYMASIPKDPFRLTSPTRSSAGDPLLSERAFHYLCMLDPPLTGNRRVAYTKGFIWYMYSPGPSRVHVYPWLHDMVADRSPANIYDPTNGTVSIGYINRSNKGEFTAQQL